MFVRTMFFENKVEKKDIDGTIYEISNPAQVDLWNSKESLVEIHDYTDPETISMNLTPDSLGSWKKDLAKLCKEWDKNYVKHSKSIYPEMNAIHMSAMKPLQQLIDSNYNFHCLEQMMASKDYKTLQPPTFRFDALEEEFSKFLTGVCEIFREYGDLKDHFDIKQMLYILKIEGWKE